MNAMDSIRAQEARVYMETGTDQVSNECIPCGMEPLNTGPSDPRQSGPVETQSDQAM